MDHAPDDECRDGEDQRRDVIEVDRPLVTDGVAELKSAYRDKPVTSAADEARSSHGEDSRELMEGQREEDDIDASQAKRRQADAQRRKHRDDRREEDREERIPAEAVDEDSGRPTADGEQGNLSEGIDAPVAHDEVPRLGNHRLHEEKDQQGEQVSADREPGEHQRRQKAREHHASHGVDRDPAPWRRRLVEPWPRPCGGHGGVRAHSRLTSPMPNKPLGRTMSIRMMSRNTPG